MSYIFDGGDGNYCRALIDSLCMLKMDGRQTSPRGQKTLELDHVVFKIDPRKSLYNSPKRKLNFFFLIAENLWYWSGRNSTELPSHYVKNYRDFSDEGIHQGAYGPMILEQIRYIVNTLKEDPDSRQANLVLWRPNPASAKDKPCTLGFDFKIRDGKLNMHATMRSNDAIWGSNYDIPSFSMIQLAVAGMLGVETGTLFLTAHSFHVYEKHFDLMDELIEERHNYSEYPESEMMLPCGKISLQNHIKNIETLLESHAVFKRTNSHIDLGELPDFYSQFHYMIALFHNRTSEYALKRLKDINSPFGTIYHERNINKK